MNFYGVPTTSRTVEAVKTCTTSAEILATPRTNCRKVCIHCLHTSSAAMLVSLFDAITSSVRGYYLPKGATFESDEIGPDVSIYVASDDLAATATFNAWWEA